MFYWSGKDSTSSPRSCMHGLFLVESLSWNDKDYSSPIFFSIMFQNANIVEKICCWDVRAGADPQQVTPVLYSHTEVSPAPTEHA